MDDRYKALHEKDPETGEVTAYQLKRANLDCEDPERLAQDFVESVTQAQDFVPNEGEHFHGGRKADALAGARQRFEEDPDKGPNTALIAARIIDNGIETGEDLPEVSYIDREIKPSRITGASEDDRRLADITTDLVLSCGGQPVICEVKARSDQNAYYALIQGLAACAQLAPPAQRARLSEHSVWAVERLAGEKSIEPELSGVALESEGPMQLWILLADYKDHGREKTDLRKAAVELSEYLKGHVSVQEYVSDIRFVNAITERSPDDPVLLEPTT